MENFVDILPALAGLLLGTAAAYINSLISKKALKAKDVAKIVAVNAARLIIDAAVLLTVYLLCKYFALPLVAPMLAAAGGLSVGGMLFLSRIAKSARNGDADGGE